MLDDLDLAGEIIPEGLKSPLYRFHDKITHEVVAEFDLGDLKDELKFPYVLQYEQYKLVRKVMQLYGDKPDFDVRFSHTVAGFTQFDDHLDVDVALADGTHETIRASYLVGCDGGRSAVRKAAEIELVGFTYPEQFIKIGTYYDFMATDDPHRHPQLFLRSR